MRHGFCNNSSVSKSSEASPHGLIGHGHSWVTLVASVMLVLFFFLSKRYLILIGNQKKSVRTSHAEKALEHKVSVLCRISIGQPVVSHPSPSHPLLPHSSTLTPPKLVLPESLAFQAASDRAAIPGGTGGRVLPTPWHNQKAHAVTPIET